MSPFAVVVSQHIEMPDETCWQCGEPMTEVFPRPCQDGCCDVPWCLDCAHAAGFDIH